MQIATWNDWGEGTQVEPSIEFGYRDLEHLQSVRGSQEDGPTTADLRLPFRLLKLRRTMPDADAQKTLDEVAQLISNGSIDAARRGLPAH